jgi:hypothetical protein
MWLYPVIASAVLFKGKLAFLKRHMMSKVTQLLFRAYNVRFPID